jgi:hypothetical protein
MTRIADRDRQGQPPMDLDELGPAQAPRVDRVRLGGDPAAVTR